MEENNLLKLNKIYLYVIVGVILFAFLFWNLLDNQKGHYSDQGYRLCINYITEERSSDKKLVAACLEKYLGLSEKIIKDNY